MTPIFYGDSISGNYLYKLQNQQMENIPSSYSDKLRKLQDKSIELRGSYGRNRKSNDITLESFVNEEKTEILEA